MAKRRLSTVAHTSPEEQDNEIRELRTQVASLPKNAQGAEVGPVLLKWAELAAKLELAQRRAYLERNPLDGVAICAQANIPMPRWLADAFLRSFYRVRNVHVRSWDAAFGAPYPKGVNLAAFKRRRLNRLRIANAFRDSLFADPAQAIDKGFWEQLGERVGVGATHAEELYREALKRGIARSAAEIRASLVTPAVS